MEEISSSQLSGSVPGVLVGDVKLVPGKRGRALYVNGVDQWVNLGNQRHSCMGNLIKCNNGFVMAMWIQFHKKDGVEHYICSGGHASKSIGVAINMRDKKLRTTFRTETHFWDIFYEGTVYLHTWYHVVVTWNIANGGTVYINGILVRHVQDGVTKTSNTNGDVYVEFILGAANGNYAEPGEMTLDELRIWDAVMDDQDVLGLYTADVFH